NQKKEAADNQFLCPITYEKLRKPVMAEDGVVYELETINQLKAQSESNDSFKSPFINKDISYYFPCNKIESEIMENAANAAATIQRTFRRHRNQKKGSGN
ncbi:MAG: U-box domain-containing protein, partial [Candidatus Marinamargulisbacteria bacterium]